MEYLETILSSKEIEMIKKENNLIKKADMLVLPLFQNKFDKSGEPYIKHLYYVKDHVNDYDEKVIALLHDTVEDTCVTLDNLKYLGFPNLIIDAIDLLTNKKVSNNKTQDYINYVKKILDSNNKYAINVKRADMQHNMDKERMAKLDKETRKKLFDKYEKAYELIKDYFEKER